MLISHTQHRAEDENDKVDENVSVTWSFTEMISDLFYGFDAVWFAVAMFDVIGAHIYFLVKIL
jgi:hypothetical protein